MRSFRLNFFVLIIFLAGVFLLPSAVPAAGADTSKHLLDNGLTVLIREMPASPVVSVYALVKTGSATEGEYLGTGISHFLEHMLFKGTTTRKVGEIADEVQAVGGSINAATSMDYTIYTITVPFESFDTALEVLADMLMHSVMDPVEIEKEREVIFGEMRMYKDDPDRKLNELAYQNIYIKHPYRHPIIGYEDLLAGVTRDDLLRYYRSRYAPNNTILSIAGNIQEQEILPKVEGAFKDFKRQRDIARNLPQEPPQLSQRRYDEEYPTDLTRLSMAFSGVSLLDHDLYAMDVLAMILGQGESSRLYLDIYKKQGLVHAISSSNYTPIDRGVFEIGALLEVENTEKTIRAVLKALEEIKKNGVQKNELEKAKRQVLSEHIFSLQKASRVTYSQAIDEAYAGDPQFSQKYVEAVRKIANEDIKRVARHYLVGEALTIVVLQSKGKGVPLPPERKEAEAGEVRKFVLKNGLTVLLRGVHELPIVSMRLSMQGGTRQEDPIDNGISQMMAALWEKGTKALSAKQIAERSESLGMGIGAFSGKNSFGLEMECLSENFQEGLGLFADIVKNPAFPDEELADVKDEMRAAIRQRGDDIFQFSGLAFKELLFLTHPLRLDDGGALESVDRIQRDDIIALYHRWLVPSNMVLTVFGDIDPEKTLEDLEGRFGVLTGPGAPLRSSHEDPPLQPREKEIFMDKEQAMVMTGFHGVDLKHKDRYGLEVLTAILGSSFSGRLFHGIREELGQAYSLGGYFAPAVDAGYICFYVLTAEKDIAQVREVLRKNIQRVQRELVPEEELEDIKTYLKGTFKAGLETNSALSFTSGLDELYGLGFDHYQKHDHEIDAVTAQDLKRLAGEYLDLNKAVTIITRPQVH